MPQEPSEAERDIVRHFDEVRATREIQEAEDTVVLEGISDPAAREAAKRLLFLIRNPKNTFPPELFGS